jgi:two-component system sensor histidine kinase KdpD
VTAALQGLGRAVADQWRTPAGRAAFEGHPLSSIAIALALVAAMTGCLSIGTQLVSLRHLSTAYLIPVVIAAATLGVVPATVAAIASVCATAFFFYPPLLNFQVSDPQQLLDLALFLIVAIVTGHLAARVRAHARLAQDREQEMEALYRFSRRLSEATDARELHATIQDHLSELTGCKVMYLEDAAAATGLPLAVRSAVAAFAAAQERASGVSVQDEQTSETWLICAAFPEAPRSVLAVNLGQVAASTQARVQHRIDAALADARATLDRLGVMRVIGDAKLREQMETLRAALIGSVSHGLRTPLASIVGSASILAEAAPIRSETQLAALTAIVRDEAERLDRDIQRLLDASRISSTGVRPNMTWADPADIVNAAAANQRRRLQGRALTVQVADELPLAYVDPVLIEQALCQMIDNATKYSPAGSPIRIAAREREGRTEIAVADDGAGLTEEDRSRMFDRFYRGPHSSGTTGSGLGLWIAKAFVTACGGSVEAYSAGPGRGSRVSIILPAPGADTPATGEDLDD